MITKETRAESLNELDKTKRYEEIRYALKNEINGLTAKIELAYEIYKENKTEENKEKWFKEIRGDKA